MGTYLLEHTFERSGAYTAYLRLKTGSCGRPTRASANVTEHSSKACVSNRPCCPVCSSSGSSCVHSVRVLSVCPFVPIRSISRFKTHPQISNKCYSSSYRHRLYSPRKTPAISLAPYCPPIPPVCPGGGGGGGPAPPGLISCAYLQLSPREQTPLWKSKQLPTCHTTTTTRWDRREGVLSCQLEKQRERSVLACASPRVR